MQILCKGSCGVMERFCLKTARPLICTSRGRGAKLLSVQPSNNEQRRKQPRQQQTIYTTLPRILESVTTLKSSNLSSPVIRIAFSTAS